MRARSFGALEFRMGEVAIKKLDYEAISTEIERVRPEARHSDPHTVRCREDHLGSDSEVRLHITYTNISIVVCIDTSKPNQPRITALF